MCAGNLEEEHANKPRNLLDSFSFSDQAKGSVTERVKKENKDVRNAGGEKLF